jgi:DNA-binding winged helix-turn-helix (wHTH) protein/tetratricopeptide (TPR) repeat protein
MPSSGTESGRELYEFGPFRVDAYREVLLRSDDPVALPPKAFQVLLVLIRHQQEVVTKDDLMKEVWPDTFVEETNLSRNIFLLRKALGESPQDHRYILTVPGRGYRLAENVRLIPEREVSFIAASQARLQVQVEETKLRHWKMVALAFAALLGIASGGFWFVRLRAPVFTGKDTVVLADFANSTGDPVFDATLRQGLSVQLGQSPYLSLVSDNRIQHTLHLMGRPADDVHLPADLARGVCVRTGSTAVLEGSIATLGSRYVLGLRAEDCRSGNVLDEEQGQAARKEDVINVLSQISGRLRKKLGESLATIDQHNIPLAEATTPSLEALRAYSLGWKATFGPAGPGEAVPFFQRAVQLDPNFAVAYAMLGRVYADLGEAALSIENTTTAYRLQDRASDPERFLIRTNYELLVTGNLEKAREVGELWAQTYPRDERPFGILSFVYQDLGKYDKSIETGKAALEIDADFVPAYANLAWAYVFNNNLNDATETIRRATERKLEFPDLYILLYDIAFLKNDSEAMKQAAQMADGKMESEHWILARQACVLAFSGRAEDARNTSHHAIQLAKQAGQPERAALYQVASATREALFAHRAEAKASALAGLSGSKSRDVEYGAAFALALGGEQDRVMAIVKDLEKRYPDDTFVKFSYLPTLRAILAENHGNPSQAIQELESESPYDLAIAGSWAGFFGDMYPVYVRGLAYLAMHKGNEAANEFQKIIDHRGRGVVGSDPVGALARLQLGRSLAMAGDNARAKSTYEDFLKLWSHADRDLPILKTARAELSSIF